MNERELQDQLTTKWIETPLKFNGREYFLVAWELMFPSWEINHKSKKWNEVSMDFILFNGSDTFLCMELKNIIKTRKPLLSAFCQTLHRTILFDTQYRPEKILKIHAACFDKSNSYRIRDGIKPSQVFDFPEKARVIPVLAAREFPKTPAPAISEWNEMNWNEFAREIQSYVVGKEMDRICALGKKPFQIELLHI